LKKNAKNYKKIFAEKQSAYIGILCVSSLRKNVFLYSCNLLAEAEKIVFFSKK